MEKKELPLQGAISEIPSWFCIIILIVQLYPLHVHLSTSDES